MKLPFANYVKAHHISHAALTAGALVAAIVFFVAGAGIRLLMGPVSLGPFAGTLAGAIQGALPGISLKYDQAAIEWSRDEGRVNLVVLGARVFDKNGTIVAQAPKADIDLAARPFLNGKTVVQRITLVGVQLGLVHMKQGGVRLGVEGDGGSEDIIGRLNDIIDAGGSNTSSLKSFAVRNARLTLFDETTGLSLLAPRASLVLSAKGGKGDIGTVLDADVIVSGRPAHIKVNLTLPPNRAPISGDATVTGLDLRGLGANAPMFHAVKDMALFVNMSGRFTIASGAHLTHADFDMKAAGEIPLRDLKQKALHVRALQVSGSYDGFKKHLTLARASLDGTEAQMKFTGAGDLHYDSGGVLQSISGGISAGRIALDMPGLLAQPLTLQSMQLQGAYQNPLRQFDIGRFTVTAPGFVLETKGSVTLGTGDEAPGMALTGSLAPTAVRTLLRYWPLTVEEGTREWIDANIFAGSLGPLRFETHFTPGALDQVALPEESLKLSFPMSGVEGSYVAGLTHVTGVSGVATLTGDTFVADFDQGVIKGVNGPISVKSGHALIPTLHEHGTVGQFTVHADGQMGDIMTLIDMKPLNYPTRFGVDPKQTKGLAAADLAFKVPMLHDVKVDDVGIQVKAAVSDFAVTLGKNTHLTNGAVNFEIDNNHLRQTGTVMLADARLAVDWQEDFKTSQPITTRLNVKGPLTESARAALNIGLATILTGTVPMNADIQGHRGQLRSADATIDLTQAAITVPILNLGKPSGMAATGRVLVNFAPGDSIQDETIRISGPGVSANGVAKFDRSGQFAELNFPSVKMGPLNDLSFTLARSAAGDDYILRGRSLDGSFVGRNGSSDSPSANVSSVPSRDDTMTGAFHIDARLDRLAMRDGVTIAPFNLDLSGVGNRPGTLALSGGLLMGGAAKPAAISAGIVNDAGQRKFNLQAADAGLLIRGLFAFESLRGGQLTLAATLPGKAGDTPPVMAAPDFQGDLTIRNFTMVNQAFLTRLFAAGSLTGMGDLMGGDGLTMEELNMPFTSKNNVISVNGARAVGRAIGASADGYIDRPHGTLALKGSLIPAYGINSLISNVPLIGDILASKKGEGIFGVTYSATGNADQPVISTNVLSMLTPGILRRIFEGHIPNASNAPSNAPEANAQPAPRAN